jgi:hypothetical protein
MQAAIADEEAKRIEVVERLAAEKGDTRWVLSVRRPVVKTDELKVQVAGWADIDEASGDSEEEEVEEEEAPSGRMRFGKVSESLLRQGLVEMRVKY